jgi:hypothetical protein
MNARLTYLAVSAASWLMASSVATAQPRPLPTDVGPVEGGGSYVVQSCGETASAEGWVGTNTEPSTLASGVDCPPSHVVPGGAANDFQQAGIWVSDRLATEGGTDTPSGGRVELAFAAPGGTQIGRVRWWRSVYKDADDNWRPYTALGSSGNVIDTCDFATASHTCSVGGTDWYPHFGDPSYNAVSYTDLTGLATNELIAGVYCPTNINNICFNGYSLTYAQVMILSAFITIDDSVAPTVGTPTGSGWTGSDWVGGTLPLAVASSDATGIAATRVYADGSVIATLQRSCSYTRPRPCTDEPDGAVGLPTAGLGDGPHEIEVGVEDAAGNETKVRRPEALLVDNAAPAAPVGLAVTSASADENRFSASWSLPADAGSPIAQAEYRLCMDDGCSAPRVSGSLTGVDGIVLPHVGTATLRVWLRDAQGHADEGGAATVALSYRPPPIIDPPPVCSCAPTPPSFTPPVTPTPPTGGAPPKTTTPAKSSPGLKLTTLRRVGRRVTVGGTVSSKASGTITVRYRIKSRGRTRTLTKRTKIRRKAFKTVLTLSPTFAAPRAATVSVTYAGDADTAGQARTATVRTRA